MRIAFYAPLKSPDHPTPSGDRRMARLLLEALELGGHDVELVSRFRSWDGGGDRKRQDRLQRIGTRLAERLVARWRASSSRRRPDVWFTYHLYHKAPDWLGPRVSRSLGIPYVVAEASHAEKHARGPWSAGWEAAGEAIRQAAVVFALNRNDLEGLLRLRSRAAPPIWLPPFIDQADDPPRERPEGRQGLRRRLADTRGLSPDRPWLLAVAMMRPGDKLASYRLLGSALGQVLHMPWQLVVIGDGPARAEVGACLERLGPERTAMVGKVRSCDLLAWYRASDLFVWPACNEAYGMALLEAQSQGLAAVAGRSGGVADIVQDGETGSLVRERDAEEFAQAVARLLGDAALRQAMGEAARRRVQLMHGIEAAARCLDRGIAGGLK